VSSSRALKQFGRRLLGVGLAVAAASCATTDAATNDRINPERPIWYGRPSGSMHVMVHRSVTATSRQVGEDYERGRPEIDARHNRVFVGSADRGLYALRASDGSTIWRYETVGIVQSEPYYDEELDTVFFGSHDGALYAVRAADGGLVFRFSSGAEVARKPIRHGETLIFANAADYLFAIDRRSGKPRWQAHRTSALGMEVAGYAGPAIDHRTGIVYTAYSDGNVAAYDVRDGSERWSPVDLAAEVEQSTGVGEAPRYLDVDTTPVLDTDERGTTKVVFVASYAGGVYALDAATGTRVWANDKAKGVTELVLFQEPAHAPSPGGPEGGMGPQIPARKILVASSGTTGLWGLDTGSGRMLWRNPVPEGGITAPAVIAGALMVGTTRYGVLLLSPVNGRVIDGIDFGGAFSQAPAAYGLRAFIMNHQGTLLGIGIQPPTNVIVAPKG